MVSPEGNVFSGLSLPSTSSSQTSSLASHPALLSAAELFSIAKGVVNETLCQQIDAIFQFHIDYENAATRLWTVDVRNSPGFVVEGDKSTVSSIPDVIFKMKEKTFQQIFYGQISPKAAYMNSSLSVSGSINVAMKLELLINKLKAV